jgi:hypothetical protein
MAATVLGRRGPIERVFSIYCLFIGFGASLLSFGKDAKISSEDFEVGFFLSEFLHTLLYPRI